MTHLELGEMGEQMALQHLRKLGHHILELRWRRHRLEIDIISELNNEIHFTEVKTRHTDTLGEPWRAITKKKQKQLIKAADTYLKSERELREAVFDVVSIIHNSVETKFEYIPNAFTP